MSYDPNDSYALTQHVRFFPEGDPFTLPNPGGLCANSAAGKPDASDPAAIILGDVEGWDDAKQNGQTIVTKKPVLGTMRIKRRKRLYEELVHNFMTNSLTRFSHEVFYRSQERLTDLVANFQPGRKLNFYGWLYMMRYLDTNELVMVANDFVELDVVEGPKGSDNEAVKIKWQATVMHSDVDSFAFGDEAQMP